MHCGHLDGVQCPNRAINVYTVTFRKDNVTERYAYCQTHSEELERDSDNERDPFTYTKSAPSR